MAGLEPTGGPSATWLVEMFKREGDFSGLAEFLGSQLERAADDNARLGLHRELARVFEHKLRQPEAAASHHHGILQLRPADQEALKAYASHFRRLGDFEGLADLLDFAVENLLGPEEPDGAVVGEDEDAALSALVRPVLEELAAVSEHKLGDLARAAGAFERLELLSPDPQPARQAQKRLLLQTEDWARVDSASPSRGR